MDLAIHNLGPHAETRLRIGREPVTIAGPSECGKTFIVTALTIALWGCMPDGSAVSSDVIRDATKAMEVVLRTADGTVVRRRRSATRWHREYARQDGTGADNATEEQCQQVIGCPAWARIVVAPMAWVPLANGPGGGRPLRDLLEEALPGDSAEAIIAAGTDPSEPRTEKAALAWRANAVKDHQRTFGMLQEARNALRETQRRRDDLPAPATVEAASVALDAAARHDAYRAAVTAREAWQARADAVREPETREVDAATVATLNEAARRAEAETDNLHEDLERLRIEADRSAKLDVAVLSGEQDARRNLETAAKMHDAASERLARLPSACAGVTSGCMAATLRQQAEEDVARAVVVKGSAEVALAEAVRLLRAAEDDAETLSAQMQRRVSAAREAFVAARDVADKAAARVHAALDAASAWNAYRRALAALGMPPAVPDEPGPAPLIGRDEARAILRAAEGANVLDDVERDTTDRIATLEATLAKLGDAVDRAEEVLALVRSAPGTALRGKLALLGDMGPITLEVPEEGPSLVVRVDGRPWELASTGRQVVADAWFRGALRRATGVDVPIVVDGVQDVGGQPLPDLEAPVVYLRTTDGAGMEVSRG